MVTGLYFAKCSAAPTAPPGLLPVHGELQPCSQTRCAPPLETKPCESRRAGRGGSGGAASWGAGGSPHAGSSGRARESRTWQGKGERSLELLPGQREMTKRWTRGSCRARARLSGRTCQALPGPTAPLLELPTAPAAFGVCVLEIEPPRRGSHQSTGPADRKEQKICRF